MGVSGVWGSWARGMLTGNGVGFGGTKDLRWETVYPALEMHLERANQMRWRPVVSSVWMTRYRRLTSCGGKPKELR